MITACKLCNFRISHLDRDYSCDNCSQYAISYLYCGKTNKMEINSELLKVGNYFMKYFVHTGEAFVFTNEYDYSYYENVILETHIPELTPEIAQRWINKLKTYCLFQ